MFGKRSGGIRATLCADDTSSGWEADGPSISAAKAELFRAMAYAYSQHDRHALIVCGDGTLLSVNFGVSAWGYPTFARPSKTAIARLRIPFATEDGELAYYDTIADQD